MEKTPIIKLEDDYNDKNFRKRLQERKMAIGINLYKAVKRQ